MNDCSNARAAEAAAPSDTSSRRPSADLLSSSQRSSCSLVGLFMPAGMQRRPQSGAWGGDEVLWRCFHRYGALMTLPRYSRGRVLSFDMLGVLNCGGCTLMCNYKETRASTSDLSRRLSPHHLVIEGCLLKKHVEHTRNHCIHPDHVETACCLRSTWFHAPNSALDLAAGASEKQRSHRLS